jgi:DNA-binding NarL/FixJ family response regulator
MQKKVMIVEDDFIIRMFIEKIIKSLGADIVAKASESKEAVDSFVRSQPDLVLMDIGIRGDLDGVDTVKLMKEQGTLNVIYLTGNSDEKTIERAKKTEPFGFIFKPIDEVKLMKDGYRARLEELDKVTKSAVAVR